MITLEDKELALKEVASRIFYLIRISKSLSQIEFSKQLEIEQGTVSKIEKGILKPSCIMWLGLCQKFNLDPFQALNQFFELPITHEKRIRKYFASRSNYFHDANLPNLLLIPFMKYLEKNFEDHLPKLFSFLKVKNAYKFFYLKNSFFSSMILQEIVIQLRDDFGINDESILDEIDFSCKNEAFLGSAFQKVNHENFDILKHIGNYFLNDGDLLGGNIDQVSQSSNEDNLFYSRYIEKLIESLFTDFNLQGHQAERKILSLKSFRA